ncbi:Uncharacterized protein DIS24_g10687 [Lasiodiplodia hormozganensis]|uniref:MYND-type domain-containing protein n=1 Tax=Lasiodiplodia hormozganensis TaxID=869390 RepID=A0AA40CG55_9PEZI|nr:Uncharacterized protein DIS24_g10687 [Lasiodiplodia hormozganensis]
MSFINDDPPATCSSCEKLPDATTTLNRCSRCRTVAYCSKACQAAHWPAHQPFCKRPNYILDVCICPGEITNPVVKRTLSCPSTATFLELHYALQLAFGWTDTHNWDFCVKDPAYKPRAFNLMDHIRRSGIRDRRQLAELQGEDTSVYDAQMAAEPRQFLLRIKSLPGMIYPRTDAMFGDEAHAHPRTREKPANKVKLWEVLDKEPYKGQNLVYTYDFGDGWDHSITIAGRQPAISAFTCTYGEGRCPFEDAGGPERWQELKRNIRARTCTEDQKFDMLNSGIDLDSFDPNGFYVWSVDHVNKSLADWKAGLIGFNSTR